MVIRRDYLHYIKKYNRYEKRHKNLSAHVSPALTVKEGDMVVVGQCRSLLRLSLVYEFFCEVLVLAGLCPRLCDSTCCRSLPLPPARSRSASSKRTRAGSERCQHCDCLVRGPMVAPHHETVKCCLRICHSKVTWGYLFVVKLVVSWLCKVYVWVECAH